MFLQRVFVCDSCKPSQCLQIQNARSSGRKSYHLISMRSEILFYSSSHIEHEKRNNFILKIFLRRFLYHRMRSDSPAPPFSQTLTDPNTCSLLHLRTSLNPACRLRRLECLCWPLLVDMKRSACKIPPIFPSQTPMLDFKRCLFSFFLHSLRHMRPEPQNNSHHDSSLMRVLFLIGASEFTGTKS